MKRLIILTLFMLITASYVMGARTKSDSINVAGITGTDTVIVISRDYVPWGRTFILEVEYSDLDDDDATFDIGTRLNVEGGFSGDVGDSTFNSIGSVFGIGLPITLDVTTNTDSYYGTNSFMLYYPKFKGNYLLFKITPGSVSTGYIRYKLQW